MSALSRLPVTVRGALPLICAGLFAVAASPVEAKPWGKYVTDSCAGPSTNCQTQFYKVRANRRLDITNVNCLTQVAGNGVPYFVRIIKAIDGGGGAYDHYLPIKTGNDVNGDYSVVNVQTRFAARAGDTLSLQVTAETDIRFVQCMISGELTKK